MDTSNSSIYGKAYEYACILALIDKVEQFREIEIGENNSVIIARQRYESVDDDMRTDMLLSAKVCFYDFFLITAKATPKLRVYAS